MSTTTPDDQTSDNAPDWFLMLPPFVQEILVDSGNYPETWLSQNQSYVPGGAPTAYGSIDPNMRWAAKNTWWLRFAVPGVTEVVHTWGGIRAGFMGSYYAGQATIQTGREELDYLTGYTLAGERAAARSAYYNAMAQNAPIMEVAGITRGGVGALGLTGLIPSIGLAGPVFSNLLEAGRQESIAAMMGSSLRTMGPQAAQQYIASGYAGAWAFQPPNLTNQLTQSALYGGLGMGMQAVKALYTVGRAAGLEGVSAWLQGTAPGVMSASSLLTGLAGGMATMLGLTMMSQESSYDVAMRQEGLNPYATDTARLRGEVAWGASIGLTVGGALITGGVSAALAPIVATQLAYQAFIEDPTEQRNRLIMQTNNPFYIQSPSYRYSGQMNATEQTLTQLRTAPSSTGPYLPAQFAYTGAPSKTYGYNDRPGWSYYQTGNLWESEYQKALATGMSTTKAWQAETGYLTQITGGAAMARYGIEPSPTGFESASMYRQAREAGMSTTKAWQAEVGYLTQITGAAQARYGIEPSPSGLASTTYSPSWYSNVYNTGGRVTDLYGGALTPGARVSYYWSGGRLDPTGNPLAGHAGEPWYVGGQAQYVGPRPHTMGGLGMASQLAWEQRVAGYAQDYGSQMYMKMPIYELERYAQYGTGSREAYAAYAARMPEVTADFMSYKKNYDYLKAQQYAGAGGYSAFWAWSPPSDRDPAISGATATWGWRPYETTVAPGTMMGISSNAFETIAQMIYTNPQYRSLFEQSRAPTKTQLWTAIQNMISSGDVTRMVGTSGYAYQGFQNAIAGFWSTPVSPSVSVPGLPGYVGGAATSTTNGGVSTGVSGSYTSGLGYRASTSYGPVNPNPNWTTVADTKIGGQKVAGGSWGHYEWSNELQANIFTTVYKTGYNWQGTNTASAWWNSYTGSSWASYNTAYWNEPVGDFPTRTAYAQFWESASSTLDWVNQAGVLERRLLAWDLSSCLGNDLYEEASRNG